MKIGEFAKRNNITQDTIRHYIDLGLLVAEKQGSQYKFTEEDSGDLEDIVLLKQLDFSLTEIQEIFCFYRLEGEKSDDFRSFYLSLLERKREQVRNEQLKFQEIDVRIRNRIHELKKDEFNKKGSIGFPITSTSLLQCPDCKTALDIRGGTIEKNMLMEAIFHCECGYIASIENGVYIDQAAVGKKKQIPPKRDFLEAASPKYINYLYNGTSTLIDYLQLHGDHPRYIMELDNCVGRFLMQYIDLLPKDCTYILICHDKERIANMKKNIELQQEHNNFIFFCCEFDRLPLTPASIDIIVDHWMSKTYAKTADKDLLNIVSPFLKQEGLLIGAYPHLGSQCKDYLHVPLKLRELFNRDKMLDKLQQLNFTELDVSELGPITEDNPYIDIQGKEQYLTLYVGKKKRNFDVICSGTQLEIKQKQNRIS